MEIVEKICGWIVGKMIIRQIWLIKYGKSWLKGQKWLVKWGLIKGCGSVSATPALRKTRNPYFLIIHPLSIELSDNFTLAVIPLEC